MHSDIKNSALYFLQGPRVGSQTRQANLHHSACSLGEPLATFPTSEKNKYFNNPTGVVRLIASSLDTDSLLNLSRVNKKCSLIFSNEYFKDHFLNKICQRFPGLEKTFNDILDLKNVNYLVHSYPSNCWKVFCWVFSKPDCRNFPVPKSNIEYKKVLLSLQANWKMLIENTFPEEIKKICGTGYADPNSEIRKAWILSEDCKIQKKALIEEMRLFREKNSVVLDEIAEIIKGEFDFISASIDKFVFGVSDIVLLKVFEKKFDFKLFFEEYKSDLVKKFSRFTLESVEGFIELAEYKKEIAFESINFLFLREILNVPSCIYNNLEDKRVNLNELVKCISNINEVNKNFEVEEFEQIHKLKLITLKNLFVFNVIKCLARKIPENKELVCMLVNSTSMRTKIWKELYDESANRITEENWSENHFHEHNLPFKCIVLNCIHLTKKQLEVLDFNENFKLKWLEKKVKILCLIKESDLKKLNILGKLYNKCAKGKIEENWSENHFHEHLVELKSLILDEYHEETRDDNKILISALYNMISLLIKDLNYLLPN